MAASPDRSLDLGRFAELATLASRYGLGLYIEPPTPGAALRNEADWLVGVIGESAGEPLGFAPVLADAIEFSFVPLERYVEAGLTGEFDYDATALPIDVAAEAFAAGLDPFAELIALAAERGCGLWFEPPWPASRTAAGYWLIGLLGTEAAGPLALGRSFGDAVVSAFPSFDRFARTGRLRSMWISGDRSTYRRLDETN
jgi:hypothetical protein